MKTSWLFLLLVVTGLSTQCASSPTVAPTPTFGEASLAVLTEIAPQVAGRWTLDKVDYQRRPSFAYPPTLPRDTTLYQFATLTLAPSQHPRNSQAGRPEFEGQLTYHGKTYPVQFSLSASPDYVLRKEGPPAYLLLEYNFPIGSHQTEPEEQFLQDIGLVGEGFSVEAGQSTMNWKGFNRHLTSITFRK